MIGILSILASVLITGILFLMSKIGNPRNLEGLIVLAQISGLGASILISWNFILATRLKFIEKIFGGLDNVYKIHNLIGNMAFILAIHHPIFLLISSLPYNATKLYLVPGFSNIPYALGIFALYILIILISITIFVDIPYKLWKKTHEFIGLVIILGSIHSLLVFSDISYYLPLRIWMIGLNIIALFAYLYKRFIYYIYIPKNNYIVTNIVQEKDYLLIDLQATNESNVIDFKAGQFAFVSLSGDRRDDHPFSILDQDGMNIRLGTKIIGSFTLLLSKIQNGSKLNIYGPFGNFSNSLHLAKNIVFLSGGIGITPFLTMLKSIRTDQDVTMIHSRKSKEPELFTNIIKKHQIINPKFKFIIHNSDDLGHLNSELVRKYVILSKDTYVYICGPQKMMSDLAEQLPLTGVLHKRIIYEDFSLK